MYAYGNKDEQRKRESEILRVKEGHAPSFDGDL